MSKMHIRDKYPRPCEICGGTYRAPTLADAVIGLVWCSGCNSYHIITEGDRRETIDMLEPILRHLLGAKP